MDTLWSRITKNSDCSAGLLACPFAHLLVCTHLLALPCLLRLRAPLCLLIRSFIHSLTCGKLNDLMAILSVFFSVLDHSGTGMDEQNTGQVSLFLL